MAPNENSWLCHCFILQLDHNSTQSCYSTDTNNIQYCLKWQTGMTYAQFTLRKIITIEDLSANTTYVPFFVYLEKRDKRLAASDSQDSQRPNEFV